MKQKWSSYDKSIYLLQRFKCSCTHFQADQFFFCKFTKNYKFINVKTLWRKLVNAINNYGIIQSYYTLSNKNNGAELMFLFNIGLSHLINKLSLISNRNLLVSWARMVKSSNEGSWLQNRRWSRIELSAAGLTFFKR